VSWNFLESDVAEFSEAIRLGFNDAIENKLALSPKERENYG